ncbi:MAG: efflux RND transporter periplasmic adaptor subunit [Sedimentisphaeraceae bacterium JB056]
MFRRIICLLILVTLTFFINGCEKKVNADEGGDSNLDKYYTVAPREMLLGITQSGTINSVKNHKIRYEASYNTQISWVIEENSLVSKDEPLIKFDDEELKSKIEELQNSLENSKKELAIAEEELEIQKSENLANLKKAQDDVTTAEENLYKYLRLEGPKAKDKQAVDVEDALDALNEAQKAYDEAHETYKTTVYDNQDDKEKAEKKLESLLSTVEKKKINYDNVLIDDKIFKRYTYPNRVDNLENALEQSKLNLKRAQVRARSSIVQKNNQIQRHQNNIERYQKNLKRHEEYLTMMELTSPAEGIILYGDTDQRWHRTEPKEGMNVYKGQVLATIPDLSELLVYMDLPEIFRSRVDVDDEVVITIESIPGLAVKGKVIEIAALPTNQLFFDPTSPKIYKTKIEVEDKDERMVTGMNVQVKVISERLKDVLSVPIEAVFENDGKLFVYKSGEMGSKICYVEIGESNDDFVLIKDGIEEGDKICLFEPVE